MLKISAISAISSLPSLTEQVYICTDKIFWDKLWNFRCLRRLQRENLCHISYLNDIRFTQQTHRRFLQIVINLQIASCGWWIVPDLHECWIQLQDVLWLLIQVRELIKHRSPNTKVKRTCVWTRLFLVFANKILTNNKYTVACSLRNNIFLNHNSYHFCMQ